MELVMTPFSIWEGLSDTQKILILIAGFFAKFSEILSIFACSFLAINRFSGIIKY